MSTHGLGGRNEEDTYLSVATIKKQMNYKIVSSTSKLQLSAKKLLYCPHCAYSSAVTGDWTLEVHETDGRSLLVYRCPECSEVVTRRPRHD
jgi:DNA-directed RNA polymerase subunit RPC12/RpoP